MSTATGQCPKCRALNAFTTINCIECGARLPWADVAQAAQGAAQQQAAPVVAQPVQPQPAPVTTGFHKAQMLGVVGSLVMAVGVFMPLVTLPFLGSINYIGTGNRDGIILLVLAIASLAVTFIRMYRVLWFTGIGSLGLLAFTFVNFRAKMGEIDAIGRSMTDNPLLSGMAEAVSNSVQLSYGFPVMAIGALLIAAAAVVGQMTEMA